MKIKLDKYTLEYTLASIKKAEKKYDLNLVTIQDMEKNPVSGIFTMVAAALIEHHPEVTETEINELIGNCSDLLGLSSKLVEMWTEELESIQSKEKNLRWEVVE